MDMDKVRNYQATERKSVRINIRLAPSQMAFINQNNLSITKIMYEALKQLGYVPPKPENIPVHNRETGYRKEKKEKPHIKHIKKHRR